MSQSITTTIIKQQENLWDFFTRKEEYSVQHLDQHGRFPFACSIYQEVLEPSVSEFLVTNGYHIEYPDDKQFAVCLTHDVDEIYPPVSHALRSSLRSLSEHDLTSFKKQVFWRWNGKEASPYWNFDQIMDLEEKYGARSSFYFLASDTDIRRFRYKIEDLENTLSHITDRGWEVGLHGS